jgi:phosphoribosylglycinamide formyltransferase-1
MSGRKRVAVLISGRGSNMAALIEGASARDYPAEISLVVSNRPDAAGLAHATERGIPTTVIDHKRLAHRAAFDAELQRTLAAAQIEIVCLAGFMRLLTTPFVEQWRGRMLNVHPSLLPAFRGLDTHARALAAGAKTHGCTVHFVEPELDSGPIVLQESVPVLDGDTAQTLATRVLEAEHRIYPEALKLLAAGKLRLDAGQVRIAR